MTAPRRRASIPIRRPASEREIRHADSKRHDQRAPPEHEMADVSAVLPADIPRFVSG